VSSTATTETDPLVEPQLYLFVEVKRHLVLANSSHGLTDVWKCGKWDQLGASTAVGKKTSTDAKRWP
jgi:hypothetical protein